MSTSHSTERLLQILRDLAAELGRSPTQRELRARRDLPSLTTYCKHFGSWNAALAAAGLETRLPGVPRYTKERLLQALRDLAAELGRSPTKRELRARRDLPSPKAYTDRFGSWRAALAAAGLETRQPGVSVYTGERLLQILRDLAAELGRSPTIQELRARRDLPSPSTYYNRFGSWNAALAAAGLGARRRTQAYTGEQLLQALRDLADELGRSPTIQDLRASRGQPLPSVYHYYRRFGSWNAALAAAGLELNQRSPAGARRGCG